MGEINDKEKTEHSRIIQETKDLHDFQLGDPMKSHKESKDLSSEPMDGVVDGNIVVEKTKIPDENKKNLCNNDVEDESTNEEERNYEKIKYPIGSVIATATVYIRGEETIEYVLPSMGPAGESVSKEQTTQVRFSWTFRGCISDHSELDWRIVALDGFGDTGL